MSVSYTHLDVYKRQARFLVKRVGEAAPAHVACERLALCGVGRTAFSLDGRERLDGCLLYTSRCV